MFWFQNETVIWFHNWTVGFYERSILFQFFAGTDVELCASTGEEFVSKCNDSFNFAVVCFNEWWTFWFAYSKQLLNIFPLFSWNQQAVVGNFLKILFWPGTSVLLVVLIRKQRSCRRTWSISWHLHSWISKSWSHSKATKHKLTDLFSSSRLSRLWPWWIISQASEDI